MTDPSSTYAISATTPDWSREAHNRWTWYPPTALLSSIRDYQRFKLRSGPLARVLRMLAVLRHRFWSAITGAEIPISSHIEGGLMIPHPNGVVIHPDARIGPNCIIFQQVTIGYGPRGLPTIGGHVDIGAGAKIIGRITVGNHAKIGANALVTFDVPDHGVVFAPRGVLAEDLKRAPVAQAPAPQDHSPAAESQRDPQT